jgi:hypothetical protein
MIPKPLPADFVISHCELSWREALWGLEHGWVDWSYLVALAVHHVERGADASAHEVELAGVSAKEWHEAVRLAWKLAEGETIAADENLQEKWLYLVLRWVYDNRNCLVDPLGIVEEIYADFGYPNELTPFVRYMPVSDGYNPQKHSATENEARLLANWGKYLATSEVHFEETRSD